MKANKIRTQVKRANKAHRLAIPLVMLVSACFIACSGSNTESSGQDGAAASDGQGEADVDATADDGLEEHVTVFDDLEDQVEAPSKEREY